MLAADLLPMPAGVSAGAPLLLGRFNDDDDELDDAEEDLDEDKDEDKDDDEDEEDYEDDLDPPYRGDEDEYE